MFVSKFPHSLSTPLEVLMLLESLKLHYLLAGELYLGDLSGHGWLWCVQGIKEYVIIEQIHGMKISGGIWRIQRSMKARSNQTPETLSHPLAIEKWCFSSHKTRSLQVNFASSF
jgi:hypothetical protein